MVNQIFKKLFIFLGIFIHLSIGALSDFDLLVFSQQWPSTTCIQSGRQSNQCNLPTDDIWTVHGIWPSKSGQKGPEGCRSDLPFVAQNVQSIRNDLLNRWRNVLDTNPEGFWSHEWSKHGVCSVDMPDLNSQLKYFKKGLELNTRFKIENILQNAGIRPGGSYQTQTIVNAIGQGLGSPAQVTCISKSKKKFLHEIRICMNKSLQLISCKGHLPETNCNSKTNVVEYPAR